MQIILFKTSIIKNVQLFLIEFIASAHATWSVLVIGTQVTKTSDQNMGHLASVLGAQQIPVEPRYSCP